MPSVWESVFMLVVLKIPVVYLVAVVWYAIRAEPRPYEGAPVSVSLGPAPPCDWHRRRSPVRRPFGRHNLGPARPRGSFGAALARREALR